MSDYFDVHNEAIEELLHDLGRVLKDSMPEGWGFTLMMFTYDKGATFYISSGQRDDIVRMMREFIEQHEGQNDSDS